MLNSAEYRRIVGRIHRFVTDTSMIGMLFGHGTGYTVVRSSAKGLVQHDANTWCVDKNRFERAELSETSLLVHRILSRWLDSGQIEQVICGGENYGGRRPCNFEWVKALRKECVRHDITFCFVETGTVFIKDGRQYNLKGKRLQTVQAFKSGMNYQGKPIHFNLVDSWGLPIPEDRLYKKHYRRQCEECAMRLVCNGCSDCGRCD